jgi:TonB-dependent SusC/RagA subfamily outer membrane receptor
VAKGPSTEATPHIIYRRSAGKSADFATINPGDIESYTVLKDASSTSIYGSRGCQWCLSDHHKERLCPVKHKSIMIFNMAGLNCQRNKLKLMTSAEKLQYEFYDRPDYGPNPFGWTQDEVDSLSKLDYDIENILFHKGKTQQHQLSVSGGNDKTQFLFVGIYF